MKFEKIINSVPFREILTEFTALYLKEYGEVQLKDISKKVHSSNSVSKFLNEKNIDKKRPRRDDFLSLIHSIYFFTFAKAEKISLASTIALCKWQREVAIPNNIDDNSHLNETFFDIIEKCKGFKIEISNTDNFFSKFYKIVEEKFSGVSLVKNDVQDNIITKDKILELITFFNSQLKKVSNVVQETIFGYPVVDFDVDLEFQEQGVKLLENFEKRFNVSAVILNLSITEYILTEFYPSHDFKAPLNDCKELILKNVFKTRRDILHFGVNSEFEDDNEALIEFDDSSLMRFNKMVSNKSNDIAKLYGGEPKCGNIFYHFHQVLGQIFPNREGFFYTPSMCMPLEEKIKQFVAFGRVFFSKQS